MTEPCNWRAPIIAHGVEGWPGPLELVQGLVEASYGAASVERLDVPAECSSMLAQPRVAMDLSADSEERLTLGKGVQS